MKDPMTDEQFVNCGGNQCPYCKSSELENAGPPEIEGGSCYQRVQCYDCGCFWDEKYDQVGWVELDNDEQMVKEEKTLQEESVFTHFPEMMVCPICGTSEDRPCFLIPIDGTVDGKNQEAQPTHVDCIRKLSKWQYNKSKGIIYQWTGKES